MPPASPATIEILRHDSDAREEVLRALIRDRLGANPPPRMDDHIVATYFFAFRTQTLDKAVAEISYHATSGIKNPPKGSLLEACSATQAGVDAFDAARKTGLLHVAFPLKMMLQPDGHLTSCDILHTAAGAVIFDFYENMDARLVRLTIPDRVLATFPGPAHGPFGARKLAGFADDQPAFGTILKPTAGITADDVGRLMDEVAGCPLLMFVKEDEDLYPNLDYSPVADRARRASEAIARAKDARGGLGLIFCNHVSGAPNEILDTVNAALDAGATGVMFSETYAGGAYRMVREATKNRPVPPVIYGHNAGIGVKTRSIFREVIDGLARLDGIDFRQTGVLRPGPPVIKPWGDEWEGTERALSEPLPGGIRPTMITRAGGLDQGNLIPNMMDVERRGLTPNVMFLAGSAINSIKNADGEYDPTLGAEAMMQALDVYKAGTLRDVPLDGHLAALADLARREGRAALLESLRQRYPGQVA